MPDISMCMTSDCDKRYTCYRYMAEPNPHRQSYASRKAEDCTSYWEIEKGQSVMDKEDIERRESHRLKFNNKLSDFIDKNKKPIDGT